MKIKRICLRLLLVYLVASAISPELFAQQIKPFHVVAFFTGRADTAHISFEYQANKWFSEQAKKFNFTYDSTKDWSNMNHDFSCKIPGGFISRYTP